VRKADNLPPSYADVKKSGSLNLLEPCGSVQACNGTAFVFTERTIRSGAQPMLSLAIRLPERETERLPSSRAEVGNACC
jgi:hypothetical protein